MARIEDYGLIGDTHTAALVSKDGSIDWLCLPRFDSPACFASLLGTQENGYWSIRPAGPYRTTRTYVGHSLVLQTVFTTAEGEVEILDLMPLPSLEHEVDVVRVVRGRSGRVELEMEFHPRFDYGRVVPWLTEQDYGLSAVAGPNAIEFSSPVPLTNGEYSARARFAVSAGDVVPFELIWYPSHRPPPAPGNTLGALDHTLGWWAEWSGRSVHARKSDDHHDLVLRSVVTLKALTYAPTGGIVAAPTTSLPEHVGSTRNWDYRFCWLRDAAFTLYALLISGYVDEAQAWRQWLMRAVAARPDQIQIMFGLSGERLLMEHTLDWLDGYENSRPVRIGNAAHRQFQLDVYGEIMDAFHVARRTGMHTEQAAWGFQRELVGALEERWREPDEGIWEVRGPRAHFTHSKVMAWVAFDRAIRAVERYGLDAPVDRWRALRAEIHAEVCERGFDRNRNTFVQSYGSKEVDAALLAIPLVGFLPGDDPRIIGTIEAVRRELSEDGVFVRRYNTRPEVDGLPPGEGAFLACTFWLADALILAGRYEQGRHVFERAITACNDLGLLSEEYDPVAKRQLGNFPQAFSHIGLVNTAHNLELRHGPAVERAARA